MNQAKHNLVSRVAAFQVAVNAIARAHQKLRCRTNCRADSGTGGCRILRAS